ncbi:MAG: MFS transporter [Sneathiella sp.]|uniref:MFS transporter n=1 Tax=Sneathiella sp. TaxID=1964365 RepID=UPI000C39FE5C|nr:MFS transporter [Sneathiella sp.]MAL78727.1 MFS transporter [Sneathiella sp.]
MTDPKKTEFVPLAIGVMALSFMMGMVGRLSFENFPNLVTPLGMEFDWSRSTVASIYSMGGLVTGLTGPLVGTLFDRLGPRNVYGIAILSGGLGLILSGLATNIWHFYFSISLLIGFGVSCSGNVPNSALASRWFRKQIPLALAMIYSSLGAGTLLGLAVSQLFIENYGWRHAQFLLGAGVLSTLLILAFLPWRRISAGRDDLVSTQTSTIDEPVIDWTPRKAMKTNYFWGLAAVFFFTGNGMFSIIIQAVTYMIEVGFPPIEASVKLGLIGIFIPVGMIGAGYLALKIGLFWTAMLTYVLTITAVICLWLLDQAHPVLPLWGFIVCFGLSMGSRGPMIGSIASRLFHGKSFGSIYGSIAVGGGLGMASGSFFSGLIYDLTASYHAVFAYSIICLVIGASPFILNKKIRAQT